MAAAGSPSVCELEERESTASERCPWNPSQPWLGRWQVAARRGVGGALLPRGTLTLPHAQLPTASLLTSTLLPCPNACI